MSFKTANSERRNNTRKRPPSLIYVELSVTNGGMMRDLSEEGFALRAMMPLVSGESTTFSFLLSESLRIEGEGEIVWVEDKGRLAGIRFTEISSQARKQIHTWLNGVADSQEAKEFEEESSTPIAQTFDQLREELRNAPPRPDSSKANPDMQASAPTPVNVTPPASPARRWPEKPPVEAMPPAVEEPFEAQERAEPPEPISFPGLPSFSRQIDTIEIAFDSAPASRESLKDAVRAEPPARRIPLPFPEEDVVARPRPPAELPDISKILMQPPRRQTNYAPQPPVLEPLEPLNQNRGMVEGSRTGSFTLSRAVLIMFVLATILALAIYRQTVGQALIWMGGQMGGAPTSQTPPSATKEGSANSEAKPAAANPPETAAPVPSPAVSQGNQEATNNPTTRDDNAQSAAVPAIPQNPPPPVTPLAGMSSPTTSESGPETGSMEYAKAMQLLHGKEGNVDPSEAVRLLWISVEKGNSSAELTLAELYWHGEGVARNCDQTRILLSAAARKGNAEAQKRLKQFQREGCE